jgi:hypothetical protein
MRPLERPQRNLPHPSLHALTSTCSHAINVQRAHALYFSPRSPHSPLNLKRSPPFTRTSHARTSRLHTHAPEKLHALTSRCSHAINELTLSTSPRALSVLQALPLYMPSKARARNMPARSRLHTRPLERSQRKSLRFSPRSPRSPLYLKRSAHLYAHELVHQLLPRAARRIPTKIPPAPRAPPQASTHVLHAPENLHALTPRALKRSTSSRCLSTSPCALSVLHALPPYMPSKTRARDMPARSRLHTRPLE